MQNSTELIFPGDGIYTVQDDGSLIKETSEADTESTKVRCTVKSIFIKRLCIAQSIVNQSIIFWIIAIFMSNISSNISSKYILVSKSIPLQCSTPKSSPQPWKKQKIGDDFQFETEVFILLFIDFITLLICICS